MEGSARIEAALRSLGIGDAAIAAALERGDPGGLIFDTVVLPAVDERTVTPDEIVARGGLEVEQIGRMMVAFGLPLPAADQPSFTEEEAEVFVALKRLEVIWPAALAIQVSRVYGRLLARIAQAETQLFRVFVEPKIRATGADRMEALQAMQEVLGELLDISEPLMLGVHHRWVEHHLAQAAVGEAEAVGLLGDLPGAVDVALLFVDLKDFTAYVYDVGDATAVEAIDHFAEVIVAERGPARFTKSLGDGFMLAYADTASSIAAGARIVGAMRAPGQPLVHASAHRGLAIAREGDYFGRVVNLAARLLTIADGDELIATREVVEACPADHNWEPSGHVHVRGVAEPVETFSLSGAALDALADEGQ